MTDSDRPVVALDFDGVLNPGHRTAPAGYEPHRIEVVLPAGARPPFLRADREGKVAGTVWVNPDHGRWITELRDHAEVVWATTWEWVANDVLAPLLGIEALPLALDSREFGLKYGEDSPGWKARSLIHRYGEDRPMVWVDDHAGSWATSLEPPSVDFLRYAKSIGLSIDDFDSDRWRSGPTLVVVPAGSVGISEAEMRAVTEFVLAHS